MSLADDRADPIEAARAAAGTLREYADDVDARSRFPVESFEALRRESLTGLLVPREYGGLGGSLVDFVAVANELAGACMSTAFAWSMHCQQVDCLVRFAPPALASRVLPQVVDGLFLASVTTEPGKTAHLLTAEAALERSGAMLQFDRQAPIVTGGNHAGGFLVAMRRSPDDPPERVTLVYAAREQVDVEVQQGWDAMGMRATESVALRLRGAVPEDQVVGTEGGFNEIVIESLGPVGYLGWSGCWIGAARSALQRVVAHLRQRSRGASGESSLNELRAARLARARIGIELSQSYLVHVLDEVETARANGQSLGAPPAQIHLNAMKVAVAEQCHRAVEELVELAGLFAGYRRDSPLRLERTLRDLRSASLNLANDRLTVVNGRLNLLDRGSRLAACVRGDLEPGAS